MTPARRAEFGRLTCCLVQAAHSYDRDDILAAEAALLAFVEREEGEVCVVHDMTYGKGLVRVSGVFIGDKVRVIKGDAP